MVTYYYYRIVYSVSNSFCLKNVPEQYRADVEKKLKANGLNSCGN